MQHLPHLRVAASHWPTAMHRRYQATRPWPLTRFHERFLSSMYCVWHIGCTDPRHIALCSAPLRVLHRRLPWPTHHHHHHHEQQQMQMRPSPLLARVAALPPVGCDCCCRCVVLFYTAALDCSSSSC